MVSSIIQAAVCFGIPLAHYVISFIADVISEDNQKKQEAFEKLYNEYIYGEQNSEIFKKQLEDRYYSELAQVKEQNNAIIKKQNKSKVLELLRSLVREQIDYVENTLRPDIAKALDTLNQQKKNFNSSLRFNSFRLLSDELHQAKQKAYAYGVYLDKYEKNLSQIYDRCNSAKEVLFSYTLPGTWPYQGKVFDLASDDPSFDDRTGKGTIVLHNSMELKYRIDDFDWYKSQHCKCILVQAIVFDNSNYEYVFSMQHGRYHQIARSGGCTGIKAKVVEYEEQNIVLRYEKDMRLDLPARNLYNFNHFPPMGQEITVYPVGEYYSEHRMVYKVSQRREDAEVSLDFRRLPLILPQSKFLSFKDYYLKHSLDFNKPLDEVKVAPVGEDEQNILNANQLLFQFGAPRLFSFIANIKEDQGKQFLWFEEFTQVAPLSADKIFIPFHAEIDCFSEKDFENYLNDQSKSEVFDNMNNLVLTVWKEFRLQYKLKSSQKGLRYFSAWENITAALKQYHEKCNRFCVSVDTIATKDSKKNGTILSFCVSDPEKLCEYHNRNLSKQGEHRRKVEYVTLYEDVEYVVEIKPDFKFISIVVPQSNALWPEDEEYKTLLGDLSVRSQFTLYMRKFADVEYKQLHALHNFKIGNMENAALQTFLLDSVSPPQDVNPPLDERHTDTLDSENVSFVQPDSLYNCRLRSDQSQYNALCGCLNASDIFFIQGPPGTGKTTVIREIVAQTICRNKDARVLIVSQANVAVDNVLKGLLSSRMPFSHDAIVRCGRSEKISNEIIDISFEKKYDEYKQMIQTNCNTSKDEEIQRLSAMWLAQINATKGFNPDIGELIVRNHNIIGATCVGLMQKRIGIEKISFDLVIIDEAGKALAPELIIPLTRAKKAIIIGDHKQLPAVIDPAVYDEEKTEIDDRQYCKKEIFDVSFFERLFVSCSDTQKVLLNTQYRMPAVIGKLISDLFYDGQVKNGAGTESKPIVYGSSHLSIIDMSDETAYIEYIEKESGSPQNLYEAQYVLHLLQKIRQDNKDAKIAVITPYKGQKKLIRRLLLNAQFDFDTLDKNEIHVDTVDSFQGDEADVVVYCTTRSQKKTQFLSDKRRINVAISRTRSVFIMLASVRYLDSYSVKEPIYRVCQYIKEHGIVQKPDTIDTSAIVKQDKDVVRIDELICIDEIGECESRIIDEMVYYREHGFFSCYPTVRKNEDDIVLQDHFEVFYAASRLSLREIPVVFA